MSSWATARACGGRISTGLDDPKEDGHTRKAVGGCEGVTLGGEAGEAGEAGEGKGGSGERGQGGDGGEGGEGNGGGGAVEGTGEHGPTDPHARRLGQALNEVVGEAARAEVGWMCKRLLDTGRLHFLESHG